MGIFDPKTTLEATDSDPRLQHQIPSISEGFCHLSKFYTPQSYRNPYQFGETEAATTCGILRQPAMSTLNPSPVTFRAYDYCEKPISFNSVSQRGRHVLPPRQPHRQTRFPGNQGRGPCDRVAGSSQRSGPGTGVQLVQGSCLHGRVRSRSVASRTRGLIISGVGHVHDPHVMLSKPAISFHVCSDRKMFKKFQARIKSSHFFEVLRCRPADSPSVLAISPVSAICLKCKRSAAICFSGD